MQTLIECKGFKTEHFFIPPFIVKEGKITVLFLYNGAHYFPLKEQLTDIFTGTTKQDGVTIHQAFRQVKHHVQNDLAERLFPDTISSYLKKHANRDNAIPGDWYTRYNLPPRTKIHSLGASQRKLADIFVALSYSRNIILDLAGQSPDGIDRTLNIIRQQATEQGAAIILEGSADLQNNCDQFIAAIPI